MSSTKQAIGYNESYRSLKPYLQFTWVNTLFKRSIAIVLFLLLWESLPRLGVVSPAFLPPLSVVLDTAWQLYQTGQLGIHFFASIQRSLIGFILALAIAIPLGLVIGWYKLVAETLNPLLELFRNTTALALMPLFILFLGIGEASKISLLVYACTWPILLNTITGVQTVDPLLIKSARTMGLKPHQLFIKVILPASVPTIFVGIRLAGAISILALVAVEMFGAKAGLGYLIIYSSQVFQLTTMIMAIVILCVIAILLYGFISLLEKYYLRKYQ